MFCKIKKIKNVEESYVFRLRYKKWKKYEKKYLLYKVSIL